MQVGGATGIGRGWPRNVSHTILERLAGHAGGEKVLADTGRETECVENGLHLSEWYTPTLAFKPFPLNTPPFVLSTLPTPDRLARACWIAWTHQASLGYQAASPVLDAAFSTEHYSRP